MKDFRITFSKTDALIYTSHLDLARGFIRVFNRANLKVKCTEGFNPHPKVVFALPLSVGMAGENELVDFSLDIPEEKEAEMTSDKLKQLLNGNMPEGLRVIDVGEQTKKFKHIKTADYRIVLCNTAGIKEKIVEMLSMKPLNVKKKAKDGEKTIEISSNIKHFDVYEEDGNTVIDICITASPDSYVNPECIVSALSERGIFMGDQYIMTRKKINFEE